MSPTFKSLDDLEQVLEKPKPSETPETPERPVDQARIPTEVVDWPLSDNERYATAGPVRRFFWWLFRRKPR